MVALVLLVRPRVAAQRCATYVVSLWYALRSTASFSGAEATHNYRESMVASPQKGAARKKNVADRLARRTLLWTARDGSFRCRSGRGALGVEGCLATGEVLVNQ